MSNNTVQPSLDLPPYDYTFNFYFNFLFGFTSRILGVTGNILNIVVLTRPRMKNPNTMILTWMAVADLCNLLIGLPKFVWQANESSFAPAKKTDLGFNIYFKFIILTFAYVFIMAMNWLTVLLTAYRYIAVCWPTKVTTWSSPKRTKIFIGVIYLVSLFVFGENLFNNAVGPKNKKGKIVMDIVKGPLNGPVYNIVYNSFQIGIGLFLPCIICIILTIRVIIGVKQANSKIAAMKVQGVKGDTESDMTIKRKKQENQMTALLLLVVFVYVISTVMLCTRYIIRSILGMKNYYNYLNGYEVFDSLATYFITFNSSINFVLYSAANKQFRQTCLETFCCKPKSYFSEGKSTINTQPVSTNNTNVAAD